MNTEELRAALRAAEQAELKAGQDQLAAIPFTYDWFVKWTGDMVMHVSRAATPATREAFAAWRKEYPKAYASGWRWNDIDKTSGMTYYLIGNYLASTGGGTLVLKQAKPGADTFDKEPRLLTDEEAAAFRAGIVPEHLKA